MPIIYELGKSFNLVTNIRRADVTEDRGWVILELDGELGGDRARPRVGGRRRACGSTRSRATSSRASSRPVAGGGPAYGNIEPASPTRERFLIADKGRTP